MSGFGFRVWLKNRPELKTSFLKAISESRSAPFEEFLIPFPFTVPGLEEAMGIIEGGSDTEIQWVFVNYGTFRGKIWRGRCSCEPGTLFSMTGDPAPLGITPRTPTGRVFDEVFILAEMKYRMEGRDLEEDELLFLGKSGEWFRFKLAGAK